MIEQEVADLYPLTGENLVEYLPGSDCRSCGFSNCSELSEALIQHEAKISQCPEIESEMARRIDALMNFIPPIIPYNVMMESFDPGMLEVGNPDSASPVLITGNFTETSRLLESVLTTCSTSAFLVVSDTKGYSLDNAVAEKRFSPFEILKVITESEVGSFVSHRNLVIPGLARHLASQIKQTTGWQVLVGPVSGFELPLFLLQEGL